MSRSVYSQHNQTTMALASMPERAMTVRAPSSVVSRSSRRHRRNRSEAGGAYSQPQNEFPIFSSSGDVEIIISAGGREQRYLLHKLYLAQCSGFFETGTSAEWSQGKELVVIGEEGELGQDGDNMAGPGSGTKRMRWRYELDPGTHEDDIPMLIQKSPNDPSSSLSPPSDNKSIFGGGSRAPPSSRKSSQPPSSFLRTMTGNFSAMNLSHSQVQDDPEDDTLRDYDNLFRIFYNYPPILDTVNIANAYVQCKSLLATADMYDALEVVGPRIDHHLLRFQGRLWKQIAKYPSSYLKLGYMSRSKAIFAESLVHVVGQWPNGATYLRSQLPARVIELIEDKVEDLEYAKMQAEAKLFRITLTTARGERVTPSNAYLEWQAVSLFRQWLAENTTPPPLPAPKDSNARGGGGGSTISASARPSDQRMLPPSPPVVNTGRVFRTLGQGGSAYLNHDECKRFLRLRPEEFSRDSLRKFERRMDEVKALAADIARPLMRNMLELDLGRDGAALGYLTCTPVEERDFAELWDD